MHSLRALAPLRSVLAFIMAASFLFASPAAIAFHNSFTLHETSETPVAESGRDRSHDRSARHGPFEHQHDRATPEHGHEAGGMVALPIVGRRAVSQPWHFVNQEPVDPGMPYLLERPPRSGTMS